MLQDISNVICLTESSLKVKMIIAVVDAVAKESLKRAKKYPAFQMTRSQFARQLNW